MLSVNGEKIIKALENDFQGFVDGRYLTPFKNNQILFNTKYHLEFSHEGEWNYPFDSFRFQRLQDKYQRRIARFRKLRTYEGKIYFIRASWSLSTHPNYAFSHPGNIEISREYALRLHMALAKYFPQAQLYLAILNISLDDEVYVRRLSDSVLILRAKSDHLKNIPQFFLHPSKM